MIIETLLDFVHKLLNPVSLSLNWVNVLQILLVALVTFIFYRKFIQNTQSEKLVKGLFILFLTWIFSEVLILINLQILGVFLKTLVTLVALSLIVIFQPELRRFLGYLGQPDFLKKTFFSSASGSTQAEQDIDVVKEIIEAVKYLTKTKTGALIVFKKSIGSLIYSEVGTTLDAKVSTELILTIFHPNTPLHDGAVVCSQNRIAKAGVILPLSKDATLSWKYGTRHRAAIGLSETTDALCLVVSEETGDVSLIQDGKVQTFYEMNELEKALPEFLSSLIQKNPPKTFWQKLKSLSDK